MLRMFLVCFTLFAALPTAAAHRPFFSRPAYGSPETAFPVEDARVSQVVYHEVTCAVPRLWLTVELEEGQELFVQLGIPVLARLADYQPALALVGPGLTGELPFAAPGPGALEIPARPTRREFFETFTQTRSWILAERTLRAPATGRYYLVAWHPGMRPGKLWVSVGTEERFSPEDFLAFPAIRRRVRAFHEVGGEAPRTELAACDEAAASA